MTEFAGLDARTALVAFFGAHAADHPGLAPIISKPDWLASVIEGMEYLYARRADLTADGAALLGDLARFISAHGFYGKGERGAVIVGVAERIAGGGSAIRPADPGIDAAFVPGPLPIADEG